LADKYEQSFRQVAASNNIAVAEANKVDANKVEAINYWYKLPFELLKHNACFIFPEKIVDVTVGDHGKEQFHMVLK
jgi:hypothetical protein